MNQDSQLGVRLKEERKRLGLSQQALADAAGVSREMWARYEAGAEPGAKALAGAAESGLDVYYALTGQHASGATVLTARETTLVENYRIAPDEAKDALDTTISLIVQRPISRKKSAGKTVPEPMTQANVNVGENHGQVVQGSQVNHGPISFGIGKAPRKKT